MTALQQLSASAFLRPRILIANIVDQPFRRNQLTAYVAMDKLILEVLATFYSSYLAMVMLEAGDEMQTISTLTIPWQLVNQDFCQTSSNTLPTLFPMKMAEYRHNSPGHQGEDWNPV